jgi:hypothetical protein
MSNKVVEIAVWSPGGEVVAKYIVHADSWEKFRAWEENHVSNLNKRAALNGYEEGYYTNCYDISSDWSEYVSGMWDEVSPAEELKPYLATPWVHVDVE